MFCLKKRCENVCYLTKLHRCSYASKDVQFGTHKEHNESNPGTSICSFSERNRTNWHQTNISTRYVHTFGCPTCYCVIKTRLRFYLNVLTFLFHAKLIVFLFVLLKNYEKAWMFTQITALLQKFFKGVVFNKDIW